ncbi:MAG: aminoglycoside phosphotransferase family protein [Pseudomonadota bacterium]
MAREGTSDTETDPTAALVRDWSLAADGPSFQTPSSWLLPVRFQGSKAMLKVMKPTSDEHRAAAVLNYFDGGGAVRVYRASASAWLMERGARQGALTRMVLGGDDDGAAEILAATIKKLHAPRSYAPPNDLPSLRRRFAALLGNADGPTVLGRCATVATALLATERERTVLHADMHHDNVVDGGVVDGRPRGWLAIDPKGVFGERTYEVANLFCNPWPHGGIVLQPSRMQHLAEFYAARLDLDTDRVLRFAFAHAGLSACWSVADGENPGFAIRCAETLQPLVR